MKNIAFQIEYDGTNYGGWQVQPNVFTVQECIQNTIYELSGAKCILISAGRTDSGVHSSGQVANALFDDSFPIPTDKLAAALNSKLPEDIRIKQAVDVNEEFHSRFNALAREYEYNFHTVPSVFKRNFSTFFKYPLDEDILFTTNHLFLGKHDFTSFSKNNPSTKSYICNVEVCRWIKTSSTEYKLIIKADRFVYGMVRSIVGSMLEAAAERIFPTDIIYGLQNPGRDKFIKLAPSTGLILTNVFYKENIFSNLSKNR